MHRSRAASPDTRFPRGSLTTTTPRTGPSVSLLPLWAASPRYLNDCLSYCLELGDPCDADTCIPGDVKAFAAFGFDNLKIDGCSAQHDVAQWSERINATGVFSEIENCGNGPRPTTPVSQGGCPHYHQYRTSGDINNQYSSWVGNAQTVGAYATGGLSGPTCWVGLQPLPTVFARRSCDMERAEGR